MKINLFSSFAIVKLPFRLNNFEYVYTKPSPSLHQLIELNTTMFTQRLLYTVQCENVGNFLLMISLSHQHSYCLVTHCFTNTELYPSIKRRKNKHFFVAYDRVINWLPEEIEILYIGKCFETLNQAIFFEILLSKQK